MYTMHTCIVQCTQQKDLFVFFIVGLLVNILSSWILIRVLQKLGLNPVHNTDPKLDLIKNGLIFTQDFSLLRHIVFCPV